MKLWQRAVTGPLGLETGARPTGLPGAGRRAAEAIRSVPAWNKSLKEVGRWRRKQREQRGSRLSVGSCTSCWASPVTKADGLATGQLLLGQRAISKLRQTSAGRVLSQGF